LILNAKRDGTQIFRISLQSLPDSSSLYVSINCH
jgi:hypothetical protein